MSSPDSKLDSSQLEVHCIGYTPPGVESLLQRSGLCLLLDKVRDAGGLIARVPTSPEGLRDRVDIAVATATLSAGIAFYLRGANWDWRTLGTVTLINTVMGFLVWKDVLGLMVNEEHREQ